MILLLPEHTHDLRWLTNAKTTRGELRLLLIASINYVEAARSASRKYRSALSRRHKALAFASYNLTFFVRRYLDTSGDM